MIQERDLPETTPSGPRPSHYDATYFSWQRSIGAFGGLANRFKFQPHVRATDHVVDFGCGGGYLLASLICAARLGVDVNPDARAAAEQNGVPSVAAASDLPDEWADVLISNSALEHVEHPLATLRLLLQKVRRGGKAVFVVPHETLASRYHPGDINQHLYAWSPSSLGNLFGAAGFIVESVTPSRLMWPPQAPMLYKLFGERAFLAICALYRWTRMVLWPLRPVDSHASLIVVSHRP